MVKLLVRVALPVFVPERVFVWLAVPVRDGVWVTLAVRVLVRDCEADRVDDLVCE